MCVVSDMNSETGCSVSISFRLLCVSVCAMVSAGWFEAVVSVDGLLLHLQASPIANLHSHTQTKTHSQDQFCYCRSPIEVACRDDENRGVTQTAVRESQTCRQI